MARTGLVGDAVVERIQRTVADAVEQDIEQIADEAASAIARDLPELSEDPETIEDIRRRARPMLVRYVAGVRDGAPPEAIETPPEYIGFVRALARRGVPVSFVLRVHGVGLRVVLAALVKRLGEVGLPEDQLLPAARAFARHLFAFNDVQTQRIGDAYRVAREEWIRSTQATRRTTIGEILARRAIDVDSAGRVLHYDLRRHHLALILWGRTEDAAASILPRLDITANEIAELLDAAKPLTLAAGAGMLSVWIGRERQFTRGVASFAEPVRANEIWAAVGEPAFGLKGFTESHAEATLAARVARLGGRPPGTATRFSDVAIAAAVADDLDRARTFVCEQLGDLAADDDEAARLRSTLQISREENGSRIPTARRLNVHPNTVSNRLRVCREILDQASASGQLEVDIALKLAALLGSSVLMGRGQVRT